MQKYILYTFFIFLTYVSANEIIIDTSWGKCSLTNNSETISTNDLIPIINSAINTLNLKYGTIPQKKFSIIITKDPSLLTNNKHWKWSSGITFKKPEKIILKDPSLSKISWINFKKVIHHELNHIMVNRFKYSSTIPRWFKEGFAMKTANEISIYHKLKIAANINNEELFNMSKYQIFKMNNKQEFTFAYALSAACITLLEKKFGEKTVLYIIQNLQQGQRFQDAFYNATNISIQDFNNMIYNYIKKNYFWFNLIKLPKNLFAIMPILLIIGFYLKSQKNKRIKEKWKLEEELEDIDIN